MGEGHGRRPLELEVPGKLVNVIPNGVANVEQMDQSTPGNQSHKDGPNRPKHEPRHDTISRTLAMTLFPPTDRDGDCFVHVFLDKNLADAISPD